jgi:hypothetical protein
MRRAFGYAGAWVAVTSTAVTVSWYGSAIVLNGSSSEAPSVLSAVVPVQGTPLDQATAEATRARPQQTKTAGSAAPRTTTAPRSSRSSRPYLPKSTPTYTKHATPPAHSRRPLPAGRLPATNPDPDVDPSAVQQTYRVAGGLATLRFSPAEAVVRVVSLTPSPGYRTYVTLIAPDELLVTFTRPGLQSDLHATWDGEATVVVNEYAW